MAGIAAFFGIGCCAGARKKGGGGAGAGFHQRMDDPISVEARYRALLQEEEAKLRYVQEERRKLKEQEPVFERKKSPPAVVAVAFVWPCAHHAMPQSQGRRASLLNETVLTLCFYIFCPRRFRESEKTAEYTALFQQFDADGSGAIDAEELHEALHALGVPATPEDARAMLDSVDDDNSGEIEIEEFLILVDMAGKGTGMFEKFGETNLVKASNAAAAWGPARRAAAAACRNRHHAGDVSDDEGVDLTEFEPQNTAAKSIKAGVEFFTEENFDLAKAHLKRAIKLAAKNKNELLQARAYGNVANVYETLMESRKAVKYYQLCIGLLRKLGETKREAFILSNAMVSYIQLKEYSVALKLAQRKLEITEKPSKRRETEQWIAKLRKAISGDIALDFDKSGEAARRGSLRLVEKKATSSSPRTPRNRA